MIDGALCELTNSMLVDEMLVLRTPSVGMAWEGLGLTICKGVLGVGEFGGIGS